MVRSTCRTFHDVVERTEAPRKHKTLLWDALGSSRLIGWAVRCGMSDDRLRFGAYELRTAVESAHLPTLQWMQQQCSDRHFNHRLCRFAAAAGHLEVLQWLRNAKCEWDESTCVSAAQHGHLAVLQWAIANGCDWRPGTAVCAAAAAGGHLHVLQWARANRCAWDEETCALAAMHGHLPLLQWVRANGCRWDASTCARAAHGGHIHILEWARANGCAWDAVTCAAAARMARLNVLRWARARGAPWDARTCACGALYREEEDALEVVQWARARGCAWDRRTREHATLHGDSELDRWARDHGCPPPKRRDHEHPGDWYYRSFETDEERSASSSSEEWPSDEPEDQFGWSFGSIGEQGRKLLEAVATEYASRMSVPGGARPKALKGIALARLRSALSAALHMAYSGRVMTHMAESRGGGHMEEDVGEDPEMPFGGGGV
ncbi:hypothetical protein JKP88DRAFT_287446 [Tribonema minus]|uniref:Ankyrin repeat protein n=1 Tax=Tribonema minus TaxID=303371 RepID=A0A835Z9Z2_9STRA|nr:hypothetical protein JKP88DRAFT_287446 [Tribonema minus]